MNLTVQLPHADADRLLSFTQEWASMGEYSQNILARQSIAGILRLITPIERKEETTELTIDLQNGWEDHLLNQVNEAIDELLRSAKFYLRRVSDETSVEAKNGHMKNSDWWASIVDSLLKLRSLISDSLVTLDTRDAPARQRPGTITTSMDSQMRFVSAQAAPNFSIFQSPQDVVATDSQDRKNNILMLLEAAKILPYQKQR